MFAKDYCSGYRIVAALLQPLTKYFLKSWKSCLQMTLGLVIAHLGTDRNGNTNHQDKTIRENTDYKGNECTPVQCHLYAKSLQTV